MRTGMAMAAAALALLAACGGGDEVPENKGVTAEEDLKLREAENMLDASPDSLVADPELGNGERAVFETDENSAE